jgi:hypothetical protein
MLTGEEKFACCQPDVVSAAKVTAASFVPVLDHKAPVCVPVLLVPL